VRGEFQGSLEAHQREIILVREKVIFRMHDLLGDAALLVRQSFMYRREVVLADSYPDLRR